MLSKLVQKSDTFGDLPLFKKEEAEEEDGDEELRLPDLGWRYRNMTLKVLPLLATLD